MRESSAYKELGEYDGDWVLDKFFKLNRRRAKELSWDEVSFRKTDKYSDMSECVIYKWKSFILKIKQLMIVLKRLSKFYVIIQKCLLETFHIGQ